MTEGTFDINNHLKNRIMLDSVRRLVDALLGKIPNINQINQLDLFIEDLFGATQIAPVVNQEQMMRLVDQNQDINFLQKVLVKLKLKALFRKHQRRQAELNKYPS